MEFAQQGHLYEHQGDRVLAMEAGVFSIAVRPVNEDQHWLCDPRCAQVSELTPLPMKYFKGQVPKDGRHG